MVKKRGMYDQVTVEESAIIEIQEVQEAATITDKNEDEDYTNLLEVIQDIRKQTGVVGFIFKSDSKATIDLNDPSKIIEYATLSSHIFEVAKTLSSTFRLGNTENMLVEGKNLNVLCIDLGQNKISIFMEKKFNHKDVLSAFLPQP